MNLSADIRLSAAYQSYLTFQFSENFIWMQVYEGAVYMNQGNTYLVQKLELSSKTAVCQRAYLQYYTKPHCLTEIQVMGGDIVSNLYFVTQ